MTIPRGALLALSSAALFGASTPLAKVLLEHIDPWLLAGILYATAGIGLALLQGVRRVAGGDGRMEAPLRGRQWAWLIASIAAGGVVGPVLLMSGLGRTPAAGAALLLNLEGVMTALLAWLIFGENVDRRIGLGIAAMTAGAGWPMGPCTLVDLVGIDVHVHASEALYEKLREPRMAPPPRIVAMQHAGLLGRKSGRGFYRYDD